MDEAAYQDACVYGTTQTIDNFGRFRGRTTMILTFNRLIMPDGRRAPISAEIIKLCRVSRTAGDPARPRLRNANPNYQSEASAWDWSGQH
jgi:hypothetical protein